MVYARNVATVAIDTSAVRYFHKAQRLSLLISYLPDAIAFDDAYREIMYQARSRADLEQELKAAKWPRRVAPALSTADQVDVLRVQRAWRAEDLAKTGNDPGSQAHLGELTAIFATRSGQADLLVMDERRGRGLAQQHGVAVMSTGGLVIQLTADAFTSEGDGWIAYRASVANAKRPEFERLVSETRERLPNL